MRAIVPMVLLLVALVEPMPALGSEFPINSYTTGHQDEASVAVAAGGDFVVVWSSDPVPGGFPEKVLGRRFDSLGVPQGTEFQANLSTTGEHFEPDVGVDAEGDFVVVWTGTGYVPGYESILGRRYASNGIPTGSFLVNSTTVDESRAPAIAVKTDGSFVVSWDNDSSLGPDADGRSVQVRRFDSTGFPQGAEIQVNSYTTDDQENPDVGVDAEGDFVVVWESVGASDAAVRSIMAQRFASGGSNIGSEFRVSYSTGFPNTEPVVAVADDGDFTVVWVAPGFLPGSDLLLGRSFASNGTETDAFQVNFGSIGNVDNPSISMDDNNAVVVWDDGYSTGTDDSGRSIKGRYFFPNGNAIGLPFQVNTFTTGDQRRPAIAGDGGRFIVVWDSPFVDGDGLGLQGQLYVASGIFADGFESGDTSRW